jgi:DNA-binding transcriptional LysR family regulator
MDHLTAMRVFITVVDMQGFSAASRALNMPLPTVSRKIAELEHHLGVQLLIRSTRKVTVTDNGQRYYEDIRHILDDLEDAERQVIGEYRRPKGHLKITAPVLFGRLHVLPVVHDFLQMYPDIDIQLFLTDRVVDLLEEHINLGFRIGPLPDSSMIAAQAGTVRLIVCASPGYLAAWGYPVRPSDLAGHQCIFYHRAGAPAEWAFRMPSGRIQYFLTRSRLMINSAEGSVYSAMRDGGLIQLLSYQAAAHIADGKLEIVLSDYEVAPHPVSIVYPQGRFVPQKIRAFIDFAMPRIRERLDAIARQCGTP